ncbi:MAG TPA: DUF2726 domain-containing protein [Candidatus Paceibacterota bacterium]
MEIFILIAIILGFSIIFLHKQNSGNPEDNSLIVTKNTSLYKKKTSVMSRSESAFFFELQKQLPTDYHIFPKMRVADVLDIPNGHDYYRMRNKALPKHIDFLICDKYFKPLVAIEVNGFSHNSFKQQEIDRVKQEMFKDSGLSLETINVGSSFVESISKIKQTLLHA